ncbi:MAG: YraN family protein [Lachnospiraceae bacterium]
MKYNKRAIGNAYERLAGAYLEAQGYQIITYNYYCRQGEIDIIARDGEYLVFCEVKYRKSNINGSPLEAVNLKKQQIISKCAMIYLTTNGLIDSSCRFDVVGILNGEIQLIKNAFDYKL